MHEELVLAFDRAGGLLRRREHPTLARRLDHALAAGRIRSPLPGVLTDRELLTPESRIAAALLWAGPDVVVVGLAAARLMFWPTVPVETVELGHGPRTKHRPGFLVTERRIPEELIIVRHGIRCTTPALTAVDLAAGPLGGDVIDRVLRTGAAGLGQLWQALELTPRRRGNELRAALLHDSRDQPWSEAERRLHRMLRTAGIDGWRTNVSISPYRVDLLFDELNLVIEVDGWETHGSRDAFESDRARRNELELAGYLVLNFTWRQLCDRPEWVIGCVRRALALRAR